MIPADVEGEESNFAIRESITDTQERGREMRGTNFY